MKKLIATICLTGVAIAMFAQGTVIFNNGGTTLVNTNGATSGAAGGGAGNFYFALLTSAAGSPPANSVGAITNSSWTFTGLYSTNTAAAGRISGGPLSGEATANGTWGVEATQYFIVVGWSINEGSTWTTILNELGGSSLVDGGYFGISAVGNAEAGGVDPNTQQTVPAASLFGAGANQIQGLTLNLVSVVPEPATLALMGLGGASLLLFRRRKA